MKRLILKRIRAETYKTRNRRLDPPVMLEKHYYVCVCVCVCFCLCVVLDFCVQLECLRVSGSNKFNKYKSQTHFIHKETVWSERRNVDTATAGCVGVCFTSSV